MTNYYLKIMFNSNEHPFNTDHYPIPWHAPKTDEEAIEWAKSMQEGMGPDYTVTLIKDGRVLKYEV